MQELTPFILELIRLTSTSLPADVESVLASSLEKEKKGTASENVLKVILENIKVARDKSIPLCQDTGTPIFYVHYPVKFKTHQLEKMIRAAVADATASSLLRPNAVDGITGVNSGNNLGDKHFPTIHFEEVEEDTLTIDLLLKGGGCENVGRQYTLPDISLKAGRDLDGVRKAALDAVFQAQGQGCAPGFLGIAVGGDRGTSYLASKEVFIEGVGSHHQDPEIATLEERITNDANDLQIGPMGFGGKPTILGTRITGAYRLPASFFVSVSYMCWAYRRRRLTISGEIIEFT
jgi:fumarate hydratase class I